MKRKFKDLEVRDFPKLETKKFEEWKNAGISFTKKYPIYFLVTFGVLFLIAFIATGNFLIGGIIPMLISMLVARGIAGSDYFKISKELGITEKNVRKLLQGKIDFIETTITNSSNVIENIGDGRNNKSIT